MKKYWWLIFFLLPVKSYALKETLGGSIVQNVNVLSPYYYSGDGRGLTNLQGVVSGTATFCLNSAMLGGHLPAYFAPSTSLTSETNNRISADNAIWLSTPTFGKVTSTTDCVKYNYSGTQTINSAVSIGGASQFTATGLSQLQGGLQTNSFDVYTGDTIEISPSKKCFKNYNESRDVITSFAGLDKPAFGTWVNVSALRKDYYGMYQMSGALGFLANDGTGGLGSIKFCTGNLALGGGAITEKMRIEQGGNVVVNSTMVAVGLQISTITFSDGSTLASSGGLWSIDVNGNLVPSNTIRPDQYWAINGSGNIVPKN
jgi:hypothetical protein